MTDKRFNFEQHLRDNPMPTKCIDNDGDYTIAEFRVEPNDLSYYCLETDDWLVTNDKYSVALKDKSEANMVCNMVNDLIKQELKKND